MDSIENKNRFFEPLRKCRFLICLDGIPEHLFKYFEIYNDNDSVIMETSFYETIDFQYDIFKLFELESIIIKYIDSVGHVVSETKYYIKGLNFEKLADYSKDGLLETKLKLIITNK